MADERDSKRKDEKDPKDKPIPPGGSTEGPGAPTTQDEPPPPPPPPGGGTTEGPGGPK